MTLYIIGTPIGNLGDITERAIETLRSVPLVFAEDTRVTGKLLAHFEIQSSLHRFDENSGLGDIEKLLTLLEEKGSAALTTDAGTPNLSDPAFRLVAEGKRKFGDELNVIGIPGPSALATAVSIAHFPVQPFTFFGFPPHKKGRETFFTEAAAVEHAVVLYESVHRIEACMEALVSRMPERECLVARELTKLHEEVFRGSVREVTEKMKSATLLGEFVIVIAPAKWREK